MKNFSLKLSLLILTCFVAFALINVGSALALNNCSDGFKIYSGNTREVDCHGVCKNVTNNGSDDIFVPTNTSNEWDKFRAYAPNISLSDCVTCSDECSYYGQDDCSGTSGRTCGDYDGDPCLEWSGWNSCDSSCYSCGDGTCNSGCGENSGNCSQDCGGGGGLNIDLPSCPHSGSDGIYVKNKECGNYNSADAWKNAGCRMNHSCAANCGVMQVVAIARVEGSDHHATAWTTYGGTVWNRKVEFCKVGNTTDLQTCPSSIYGSEGEVWITDDTNNWDSACQVGTSCKNSGWNWGVSSGYYWGNCWSFGGTTRHCPTCIIR